MSAEQLAAVPVSGMLGSVGVQVLPGGSVLEIVQVVGCLLATAQATMLDLTEDLDAHDSDRAYCVHTTLEIAAALIGAAQTIALADRRGGAA